MYKAQLDRDPLLQSQSEQQASSSTAIKQPALASANPSQKFFLAWRRFFHPQSVHETGGSRLVSLDFLRGVSIFVMLYGHEVETALDIDYEMAQPYGVFAAIVAAPAAAFASFRTFFILQSGATHAFIAFQGAFSQSFRSIYLYYSIQLAAAFASWPLWYLLHYCNTVMYGFSKDGGIKIAYPFWRSGYRFCHATAFFGIVQPICLLVSLIFITVFVAPYRLWLQSKLKRHHVLFTMFFACFSAVVLILFNFMGFASDIKKLVLKSYPSTDFGEIDVSQTTNNNYYRSCPANAISHVPENFGDSLNQLFLLFLGGKYLNMNPQFAFYMMGMGYGCLLAAFKSLKTDLTLQYNTNEDEQDLAKSQVLRRYQAVKRNFLLFFALFPLVFVLLYFGLNVQVKSQFNSGIREPLFVFSIACYFPNNCQVPEFSCGVLAVQCFLFSLALLIFETNSIQVCKIRAERILFLRRFSTYSLSCFVFGYFLSFPLKALGFPFQVNETGEIFFGKLSIFVFLGYIVTYFFITFCVHCLLDQGQGFLTPDWMVQRFRAIFNIVPQKAFNPISNQHLHIMPINLFGIEL